MFKALGVHSGIVRRGGSDHEFLIIILMLIWIVISMNVISSVHCYRDHKKPLRIKSPAVICSVARRPSPQPGISLIFTFGDIIGGD